MIGTAHPLLNSSHVRPGSGFSGKLRSLLLVGAHFRLDQWRSAMRDASLQGMQACLHPGHIAPVRTVPRSFSSPALRDSAERSVQVPPREEGHGAGRGEGQPRPGRGWAERSAVLGLRC